MNLLHYRPRCSSCVRQFLVYETDIVAQNGDYSAIELFSTQNQVRHAIAILCRLNEDPAKLLRELRVSYNPAQKLYTLWAYTRNWTSFASYLAGMLETYKILKKRNSGRRTASPQHAK